MRAAVCSLALSGVTVAGPIAVERLNEQTDGGPAVGFVARIDLRDPAVDVIVTAPLAGGAMRDGRRVEAILTPTDEWARTEQAVLAINANFFGKVKPADGSAVGGGESDIVGLSMSAGVVVSGPRMHDGRADPALVIRRDGSAAIGYLGEEALSQAEDAVAGVGGGERDTAPGTLLVDDGTNLGATARVQPTARHPRTAAGVSADGRTLILVVVDGRQPGYSVGMTLPELGDLMIRLGAADAINLDGGGSSSFVYRPSDREAVLNRPSDGRFRPVANHLGVRVRAVSGTGAEK